MGEVFSKKFLIKNKQTLIDNALRQIDGSILYNDIQIIIGLKYVGHEAQWHVRSWLDHPCPDCHYIISVYLMISGYNKERMLVNCHQSGRGDYYYYYVSNL